MMNTEKNYRFGCWQPWPAAIYALRCRLKRVHVPEERGLGLVIVTGNSRDIALENRWEVDTFWKGLCNYTLPNSGRHALVLDKARKIEVVCDDGSSVSQEGSSYTRSNVCEYLSPDWTCPMRLVSHLNIAQTYLVGFLRIIIVYGNKHPLPCQIPIWVLFVSGLSWGRDAWTLRDLNTFMQKHPSTTRSQPLISQGSPLLIHFQNRDVVEGFRERLQAVTEIVLHLQYRLDLRKSIQLFEMGSIDTVLKIMNVCDLFKHEGDFDTAVEGRMEATWIEVWSNVVVETGILESCCFAASWKGNYRMEWYIWASNHRCFTIPGLNALWQEYLGVCKAPHQ